jgi:hypothetical protein
VTGGVPADRAEQQGGERLMPREPSTSICAPEPLSVTAWAVGPRSGSVSMSTPGAVLAARSAAAASAWSRSPSRTSVTLSYSSALARDLIPGDAAAAAAIRSGAPRSAASLTAQSTARSDSSEPSVPATMGLAAIDRPPWRTLFRACRSPAVIMTAGHRRRLGRSGREVRD